MLELRQQRRGLERLRDIIIHTGGEHFLAGTRHRMRGERDDRHLPGAARQVADFLRGGDTVELGHLQIHQDHVVIFCPRGIHRLAAIIRQINAVAGMRRQSVVRHAD